MGVKDFLFNQAKRQAANKLKTESTPDQVAMLSSIADKKNDTLRGQFEQRCPKEMLIGVRRIVREGKIPTVDLLLHEYRTERGFKTLMDRIGLPESWFIELAEKTMKAEGINANKTE